MTPATAVPVILARAATLGMILASALTLTLSGCTYYEPVRQGGGPTPGYVRAPGAESAASRPLTVTFLGNATVLVSDGDTALMTDGFLSRPPWWRVLFGRIAPDGAAIEAALERAGVDRLGAVLVSHTHYDHAMDAALVARLTGAKVVGSPSARQIALGGGVRAEDICVVVGQGEEPAPAPLDDGDCVPPVGDSACRIAEDRPLCFGDFRVTLVGSEHGPALAGDRSGAGAQRITEPLRPPARYKAYKQGEVYSIHIQHPRGDVLVHGSAGFRPGALRSHPADLVFLGVALLGEQPPEYARRYYREVVQATGARTVVPVHWDDFTARLEPPLGPLPDQITDISRAMDMLQALVDADPGVSLLWPRAFAPIAVAPSPTKTALEVE